jgi:hypothetical protein
MRSPTTLRSASSITASTSSLDNIIITKIENATEDYPLTVLTTFLIGCYMHLDSLCDYMSSLRSEINPSDHYRKNTIILLCNLSIFFKNTKLFKQITREDLLSFLDSYRKAESADPLHKWIGTYSI